jgi:hypothetical protein
MCAPPFTSSVAPVMYDDKDDARNKQTPAISPGEPARRSGHACAFSCLLSSVLPLREKSVRIKPGLTALTRIFSGPSSRADRMGWKPVDPPEVASGRASSAACKSRTIGLL